MTMHEPRQDTAAGPSAPAAVLGQMTAEQLERVFGSLQAPQPQELEGDYPGAILAVPGLARLPRGVARLLRCLASWLWRAKAFSGGSGVNLWLPPRWRGLSFCTVLREAAGGGGTVCCLDYDIAGNPRRARRVRGALRRLAPGRYLGRMLLRSRAGQYRLVAYFILQRPGAAR